MSLIQRSQRLLTAIALTVVLMFTAACGAGVDQADRALAPSNQTSIAYQQLERGNTTAGQSFGDWVLQTGRGLFSDAYVRDNDKLGVVITPQVKPRDVRDVARSLVQGFHRNFPDRDVTVLVYAPDKELLLTARYDRLTNQIEYNA